MQPGLPLIIGMAMAGRLRFAFKNRNSMKTILLAIASIAMYICCAEATVVEIMPQFPGGAGALAEFIRDTGIYPEDAVRDSVEGRVVVTFTVDILGNVCNPRVVHPVHPSLDAEALRVVNSMPRWIPGTMMGRAVKMRFVLPVLFLLDPARAKKNQQPIVPQGKR